MTETWAIVELMGHVRLAGRVTEEEKFGTKMGRIDIPAGMFDGITEVFTTQFFGGSSVYRITAVAEEVARSVAAANEPHPVRSWEFPKPQHETTPALNEGRDSSESLDSTDYDNDAKEEEDDEGGYF